MKDMCMSFKVPGNTEYNNIFAKFGIKLTPDKHDHIAKIGSSDVKNNTIFDYNYQSIPNP